MAPLWRWFFSSLSVLIILSTGCNILSLPFFIFGPEPKVPPLLHRIAPENKEKEATAVILVAGDLETRSELIRADRDLAQRLAHHLKEGCKYNEEKVRIVSPAKIDQFKSNHPDWQKWLPAEIGQHFKAEWVIHLEIDSLSLYERGSSNQLYRGRAEIKVSLIDVKNPEDGPREKFYTGQYPGEAKPPVEVSSSNSLEFRRLFLDHVAEQISWYFTAHPTNKDYACR
jgi:hypothetical protein